MSTSRTSLEPRLVQLTPFLPVTGIRAREQEGGCVSCVQYLRPGRFGLFDFLIIRITCKAAMEIYQAKSGVLFRRAVCGRGVRGVVHSVCTGPPPAVSQRCHLRVKQLPLTPVLAQSAC